MTYESKPCQRISVIETNLKRQGGTSDGDPVRLIRQFWTDDGKLLIEVDEWKEDMLKRGCSEFLSLRNKANALLDERALQPIIEQLKHLGESTAFTMGPEDPAPDAIPPTPEQRAMAVAARAIERLSTFVHEVAGKVNG